MVVDSPPPVIDELSELLILGPAPGEWSAFKGRYYVDKYNIFWDVVSTAFDYEIPFEYDDRLAFLVSRRIALWHVLARCEREDDIDSSIRDGVPNDLPGLFDAFPRLRHVIFNGRKASRLFRRHFGHQPPQGFSWVVMPSTTATPVRPARFFRPYSEVLARGSELLKAFLPEGN